MAEEYTEEVEELQELTAEEILEQHKAEIEERFTEKGFFTRLGDMFSGLGKPHDSREYKAAVIELQRLKAPIIGILLPVIGVIILIVVTAVQAQKRDIIQVDLSRAVEDPEEFKEEEPEPEPEPEPPEEMPDIQVDNPVVGPPTEMVSNQPVSNEPVSVKPATQDSVAIIKSPVSMRSMSGSRNPGSIGAMTRGGNGYGDASTEAAVLKALRWLKKSQNSDGSWNGVNKVSNTGLAILCYLAHGETPTSKEFGYTVEKAIGYLIAAQTGEDDKVTFKGCDGNEYATLIATYALGEAFGMTDNPDAKAAALKSMTRIVRNQSPTGGWDYKLNKESTRDDLSYAGWALQALKACKLAGLHPDGLDDCIKKAMRCLESRNFKNGAFGYTAESVENNQGLTATGCLAMQLLGYGDRKEVAESLNTMRNWLPTFKKEDLKVNGRDAGSAPQYYCYYASQCKYQAGMKQGATPENVKSWQDWNVAMKKLYTTSIQDGGPYEFEGKPHATGFWKNDDTHGIGEPVMSTCLCALQLMVYYRYLPTTQAEKGAGGDSGKKQRRKADVKVDVDI